MVPKWTSQRMTFPSLKANRGRRRTYLPRILDSKPSSQDSEPSIVQYLRSDLQLSSMLSGSSSDNVPHGGN